MSIPQRRSRSLVTSKPQAKIMQSTSYSLPLATKPLSVMRSTPLVSETSISCTLGTVEGRIILIVRQGTLAQEAVVRLQRLGGFLVLHDLVDAAAQTLHHAGNRSTSRRAANSSRVSSGQPSASSSAARLRLISVQMSQIKIRLARAAALPSRRGGNSPAAASASRAAAISPTAGSVGGLGRSSTLEGVRWRT